MKEFIQKDWNALKSSYRAYIISMLILSIAFTLNSYMVFPIIVAIIFGMATIKTTIIDRVEKYDESIEESQIPSYIKGKYVMYIIFIFTGLIVNLTAFAIGIYLKKQITTDFILQQTIFAFSFALILGSLHLPMAYFLPVNKSMEYAIITFIGFVFLGAVFWFGLGVGAYPNDIKLKIAMYIILAFSLVFYFVSYKFYVKNFRKIHLALYVVDEDKKKYNEYMAEQKRARKEYLEERKRIKQERKDAKKNQ